MGESAPEAEPQLPDPDLETGGELDHTATAIPLDKLVASNVPVEDEEK